MNCNKCSNRKFLLVDFKTIKCLQIRKMLIEGYRLIGYKKLQFIIIIIIYFILKQATQNTVLFFVIFIIEKENNVLFYTI